MQRIKKILVTTDFSDTSHVAFSLARQLAEKFEAEITLLYVLEVLLPPPVVEPGGLSGVVLDQQQADHASSQIEVTGALLGKDVETAIVTGTPHVKIVQFAEDSDIDLIVMATHGRGFFSHALLGSTAERVVRRAPCPVLTVRDRSLSDVS
jgi:universal stress protein A